MKLLLCTWAVLLASGAADNSDLNQPQSPPRPAPAWVKGIDQGANDPRLKGYKTPEGLKVEIVAENPVVVNPVGMTFADDGTPYVIEWRPDPKGGDKPEQVETVTYKDGSTRKVVTMKKHVTDLVKTLRDAKGKGAYDEARVVLEDYSPSSILPYDGWLYLSGRGSVRRYKQSKGEGPYDVKEVIAQGFCGYGRQQVSGMTIGPDGWLYLTSGDDDNVVEGSDGSRATVLRTGAVFRCRPDGSKMQTYAIGFHNPYGPAAFDAAGNLFQVDGDNEDAGKFTGCRLMHVPEGADFGWRLQAGAHCCAPDPVRAAAFGELPGKLPSLLKTGRGAPAGLCIYNDTRLPENYRGLLFYPDPLRKLVRAYKVEPKGASFEVAEEFEFLKSDDPLFRPCQMLVGPDGALYVVDFRSESGVGGLGGDGEHGRIYRITWSGVKDLPALAPRPMDSWAKIAKQSDDDLIKTLCGPDACDRERARRVLAKGGDKIQNEVASLLKDRDRPLTGRIAALGALESMWTMDVQEAFQNLLRDGEPDLRRLAADALALNAPKGDEDVHASLLRDLSDRDPAARRAVALAIGHIAAPAAPDNLVNTWAFEESQDPFLRDGLVRAIESLGKPGIERLTALSESGLKKDIDKVVYTFTTTRTRPAAEAVPDLLKYPHLTAAQRAALVRSYANYQLDPPISLEPLLEYLTAHPEEVAAVKLAGLEVLSASGPLRSDKADAWLTRLLDEKDPNIHAAALKAIEALKPPKKGPRDEK